MNVRAITINLSRVVAALLCVGTSRVYASQFNFGADDYNYFADASGAWLPDGDLVQMGYFPVGSNTIAALATGGTLTPASYVTLLSDFVPLNMAYELAINNQGHAASGVLDGTFEDTNVSFNSQAIYVMVFNNSSTGTATQVGVFTGNANWTYFANMADPLNLPKSVNTDDASSKPVIGAFVSGIDGSTNPYNWDSNGYGTIGALELAPIITGSGSPTNFVAVAGAYSGLAQSNAPSPETTGLIDITMADTGSFSAKLNWGGTLVAFKGRFDNGGDYSTNLVTKLGTALSITLHAGSTNTSDQITGAISTGSFTSEVIANRAVFNAAMNPATRFQGYYTIFLLPDAAETNQDFPQGDGYGTLKVDATGKAKLSGTLGDGTKISQTAVVSKDGSWPVYIPLYGKKGLLSGWVTFSNVVGVSDCDGTLTWAKPAQPASKFYPAGFTDAVTIEGARYVAPPSGTSALAVTNPACNLLVTLGNGNLGSVLSNSVRLDANNKVTSCITNGFKLTVVPTTGLFSGTFLNPATHKTTKFSGALSQKQNVGAGFFLGTNQTGFVTLEPSP